MPWLNGYYLVSDFLFNFEEAVELLSHSQSVVSQVEKQGVIDYSN